MAAGRSLHPQLEACVIKSSIPVGYAEAFHARMVLQIWPFVILDRGISRQGADQTRMARNACAPGLMIVSLPPLSKEARDAGRSSSFGRKNAFQKTPKAGRLSGIPAEHVACATHSDFARGV
jgi:hypothetical protein